jgi:hypothetical protein
MVRGVRRDGNLPRISEIVQRQSTTPFHCSTNWRYQREEISSPEACEELKKRADTEIETAEKKSAVRRKLEEAEKKTPKKEKKKGKGVSKKE